MTSTPWTGIDLRWPVRGLCGVLLILALAGCSGSPAPQRTAVPAQTRSVLPFPSPSPPPVITTDGCRGLVTVAQVNKAVGRTLKATGGDGAGAASQYAKSFQGLGMAASAKVCAFSDTKGDQVSVVALTFGTPAQAGQLFTSAASAGSLKPVTGVGDAAVTDHSGTMLVRRGKTVIAIYLVVAGQSGDHTGTLTAIAALLKS